jgi:phage terminase Nu1 subunit (DNA packaging protein)
MQEKLSTAELIALTNFSRPYLNALENADVIRRDGRDQWPIGTIHAIIQHLRHENRRGRRSEASDRLANIKAEALEVRIKRESAELIPMIEVREVITAICGGIVSRLAGLPARFTRDLNERTRLEIMLNAIRTELADLLDSEAARLGGENHNGFNYHEHNSAHPQT